MIQLSDLLLILIVGSLCGFIPLIAGYFKGKYGLGTAGFFSCIVSEAMFGLLLAVPVGWLFLFFIFKKSNNLNNEPEEYL